MFPYRLITQEYSRGKLKCRLFVLLSQRKFFPFLRTQSPAYYRFHDSLKNHAVKTKVISKPKQSTQFYKKVRSSQSKMEFFLYGLCFDFWCHGMDL